MKTALFLFFILFYSTPFIAQEKATTNDFFEIQADSTIKFYLGVGFRLAHKKCSSYYMLAQLDKTNFVLKDSVKIFYNDNNLQMKGYFSEGKKNGSFTFYFDNGSPESEGIYENDLKKGNWRYYYPNGNLKKVINFGNEYAILTEFYDKNSEQVVKNGNGNFSDELYLYYSTVTKSTVTGTITDGALDGKWEIYTANVKTATEYFKDKKFIKGISHSRLVGDVKYNDQFFSSFVDTKNFDVIKLASPPNCIKKTNEFKTLDVKFYEAIRQSFNNSELKNNIENGWFYVEIKFDYFGDSTIRIFSLLDDQTERKMKEVIYTATKTILNFSTNKNTTKFFPVVIKNNFAYLTDDPGFSLMSDK